MMHPKSDTRSTPESAWPADGLERVQACPACCSSAREKLFDDLTDVTFFSAPGKWTLWRCGDCRSVFLDPRPTIDTIGLAYSTYYTHKRDSLAVSMASPRLRVRKAAEHIYRRLSYGRGFPGARLASGALARLLPGVAQTSAEAFRFLPPLRHYGHQPYLLDVGCGAGEYLSMASQVGWRAYGVDFDPLAVAEARAGGAEAYKGDIRVVEEHVARYDVIRLNHVVEHLYDPAETLRIANRILRPGGLLYIQTPNSNAWGLENYGRHWRGLEVPRHILIFSVGSLTALLRDCGFVSINSWPTITYAGLNTLSRKISHGLDPYGPEPAPRATEPDAFVRMADGDVDRSEFITMTCSKPK